LSINVVALDGWKDWVDAWEGRIRRIRNEKKMRLRLFAIWKLIEILFHLWSPAGKPKEERPDSVSRRVASAAPFMCGRRVSRKWTQERPMLEGNRGSHLIKRLKFSFPLDFRSPLLPHRIIVMA
jgi:hypothetical protein